MTNNGERYPRLKVIIAILALIIPLMFSGYWNYVLCSQNERLNQENLNLAEENQRLYNESLRADLNIFVEQIADQNWTFTIEGAYFETQVMLFNDGARATEIRRAEAKLTFTSDDGKITHSSTNPLDMTSFTMKGYVIEKGASRAFTIGAFIEKFTWKSPNGSRELEIGVAKPTGMNLTIWYYDNIDEKVSYGIAY